MTSISRTGAGSTAGTGFAPRNDLSAGSGHLSGRNNVHTGLADGGPLDLDEGSTGSPNSTTSEREAGFLRSFRAAIRDAKRDTEGQQQDAQQQKSEARIIALAEQQLWTGLPSPADAAPAVEERSPDTEAIVATVTETIHRSIRSEMAPRAGAPLEIRLAFQDEQLGLSGLRLVVTSTSLDVVFERVGPALSEELVGAAEALAKRLMTRLSKKVVRVFDEAAPCPQGADKPADATDGSLASLFT